MSEFSYNLRPRKVRRLNDGQAEKNGDEFGDDSFRRKSPIQYVPTEIIEMIFKFISFHELSFSVRLVNHRFKCVAESMLNAAFKKISPKLEGLFDDANLLRLAAQNNTQFKRYSVFINAVEVLQYQYTHILNTVQRYIFNDFYFVPVQCCFYGGLLVDSFYAVIRKLKSPIERLTTRTTEKMNQLIEFTKCFCNHFDRIIEEEVPNCIFFSGAKIVDILDGAFFARRTVVQECVESGHFRAEYSYFFANSWFIALPIPANNVLTTENYQRLMHMRLRRVVLAHTEMNQKERCAVRETNLVDGPLIVVNSSVYTGYGDIEGTFFYYGVMNRASYGQKFNDDEEESDGENEEHFQNAEDVNPVDMAPIESNENILYNINRLGLTINVHVSCPLSCAPFKYLNSLDGLTKQKFKKGPEKFKKSVKLVFDCPGAYYPEFPSTYERVFESYL